MLPSRRVFLLSCAFLIFSECVYDLVFANLAYAVDGQAWSVGTTYALGYVAEILVTILGAGFLDRLNKIKCFLVTQALALFIFIGSFFCIQSSPNNLYVIWGSAFLIDMIHHYAHLAAFTLIPCLFREPTLTQVNGDLALINSVSKIAGPMLGTVSIVLLGLSFSLSISCFFLCIALGASYALMRFIAPELGQTEETTQTTWKENFYECMVATPRCAKQLLQNSYWRGFLSSYTLCLLVFAIATLLWIPFLIGYHGLESSQTGLFLSIGAFGGVCGGLCIKRFETEHNRKWFIYAAHWLVAVSLGLIFIPNDRHVYLIAGLILFDFAAVIYFRSTAIFIQTSIPKDVLGRWYGAIDFMSRFFGMLGILLATAVLDHYGAPIIYAALILGVIFSSFRWLYAPQRSQDTATDPF